MSYLGPSGINTLFYSPGNIKSGMSYTTWNGGQPGSSNTQTTTSDTSNLYNCMATAQIGATLSAITTNPTTSKARYKSSLEQLQKHFLQK